MSIRRTILLDLPFGSIKDTLSTLTAVDLILKKWHASTSSEFGEIILRLMGLFPVSPYINNILKFEGLTIISSIAASSDQLPPIFGQIAEELFYFVPIIREYTAGTSLIIRI
jgi:hypothetical protein